MDTARLDKYGIEVCEAFGEVARHKWDSNFDCRKCHNTKYFEGKTPFSRRCSNCKTDESATAGTVFDKLRIPLPVVLDVIRRIIESDTWLKSTVLTSTLEEIWNIKLRQQTIWDLLYRIYNAIKTEEIIYDEEVLYVTFYTGEKRVLVSKGISNSKEHYWAESYKTHGINVAAVVSKHTKSKTKVAAFNLGTTNWRNKKIEKLRPNQAKIINRPTLVSDDRTQNNLHHSAIAMAKDIWPWIAGEHLNLYIFKRDSNDYEALMKILTRNYIKGDTGNQE